MSVPDVAVITAIYDNYDVLKPVLKQVGVDVEWVLVTDAVDGENQGFDRIHIEPSDGLHPNRAAKTPKMRPWLYTEAPVSIWIDASFCVTSKTFARDMLKLTSHGQIIQFMHPWRNCIYDEAKESIPIPKYAGEPIAEQAFAYHQAGMPVGWGLWATGVIVRTHTKHVKQFSRSWHEQIRKWSFQDQISEPYALWKNELRPVALPGTHFRNEWLVYEGSGRH